MKHIGKGKWHFQKFQINSNRNVHVPYFRQLLNNEIRRRKQEEQQQQQADGAQRRLENGSEQIQELENY